MAFSDFHPPVGEVYYEMWLEGGDLIVKLPLYAERFRVDEAVFLDDVQYKVERIEHRLTSEPDRTIPPDVEERNMGFGHALSKVWVSIPPP